MQADFLLERSEPRIWPLEWEKFMTSGEITTLP